jgi:hypothetical protein
LENDNVDKFLGTFPKAKEKGILLPVAELDTILPVVLLMPSSEMTAVQVEKNRIWKRSFECNQSWNLINASNILLRDIRWAFCVCLATRIQGEDRCVSLKAG